MASGVEIFPTRNEFTGELLANTGLSLLCNGQPAIQELRKLPRDAAVKVGFGPAEPDPLPFIADERNLPLDRSRRAGGAGPMVSPVLRAV